MKTTKNFFVYIALLTIGVFMFPSCNLDEKILDSITQANFGNKEKELDALVGTGTLQIARYWNASTWDITMCTGDMMLVPSKRGGDYWDGGAYRDLHHHIWDFSNSPIRSVWNRAVESISKLNFILNEVEKRSDTYTPAKKARVIAELRGIRAFWFYVMIDNWGNIPFCLEVNPSELVTLTPRAEAYQWVVAEVEALISENNLYSEISAASYGKFTKGAAHALLAKMYLNAEAWKVSGPQWAKVIAHCDEIIKLGYQLEPVWKQNFIRNNHTSALGGPVNREAILSAVFDLAQSVSDYRYSWAGNLHYLSHEAMGHQQRGNNKQVANPDYVLNFYVNGDINKPDPRLEGSFLMGPQISLTTGAVIITAHGFELNFTREVPAIATEGPNALTARSLPPIGWWDVEQHVGFRQGKWEYGSYIVNQQENDVHIFRLADIYLMKAEALVRSGGDNAEATRLTNAVRSRAWLNDSQNYASATLDNIFLERKLEFAWECWSRQDCIRFGTFQSAHFWKEVTSANQSPHLLIFPIPRTALEANPALVQNPGYVGLK